MIEGIIGGVASGAMGMVTQNKQQQINRQAARESYEYNERAANNAFARDMLLYERTYKDNSPEARLKQIKEAGLSPALMYGGVNQGGAGQATTHVQEGADVQPARMAEHVNAMSNAIYQGMQNKVLNAQAENIQADTNKKEAETENLGAETKLKTTQIQSLLTGIESEKIKQEGYYVDNDFKRIKTAIAGATAENVIKIAESRAEYAKESIDNLIQSIESQKMDNEIKRQTMATVIESYNANLENVMADTMLKKSADQLNKAEAKKIAKEIIEITLRYRGEHGQQFIDREKIAQALKSSEIMKEAMENSAWITGGMIAGGEVLKGLLDLGSKALNPMKAIGFGR